MEHFIAVDWGTTNRRAYRIEDGAVVATHRDTLGVTSVSLGGFAEEVDRLRRPRRSIRWRPRWRIPRTAS